MGIPTHLTLEMRYEMPDDLVVGFERGRRQIGWRCSSAFNIYWLTSGRSSEKVRAKSENYLMALNAYLVVKAHRIGEIKGSGTARGREGKIEVYGWSHEVISPRDAASGLPTGKRQHKPLVITKPVDKASPLLMNVLVNNDNLVEFKLECWRATDKHGEEQYFTIRLVNANIAGIRQEQLNNAYPENLAHEIREHISFTYQKIEWTWTDGGITAMDDWESPVV